MTLRVHKKHGFTIVELAIVIVIIGILASITLVSYSGAQRKSRATKVQADITEVNSFIEEYYAKYGLYPKTGTTLGSAAPAFTDANCSIGTKQSDWVPEIQETLPQSNANTRGAQGVRGCYMYQSNGTDYVLSAWNLLEEPQTEFAYRRLGFREIGNSPFYYCNQYNIGGSNSTLSTYTIARDYYKYSYTFSSITSCNETPPSGA